MKLPDKKYSVIYADPPWSYRQHGTGPKSRGNAAQHYHTMTTEDICALPIRQLAGGGQGCVLFMWATFPQVADALRVMEAWGFTYKTAAFVWVKKNRKSNTPFWGMGAYTRANAEICLLGVTPDFRPAAQIKSHAVHQCHLYYRAEQIQNCDYRSECGQCSNRRVQSVAEVNGQRY